MGMDIELIQELRGLVSEMKSFISQLKINGDGSIDVNSLNFVDSIAIKDALDNNKKVFVSNDGRLLVDTNLSISPNSIITDPDDDTFQAKVNSSGRLLVETEQLGSNDSVIIDPDNSTYKAKVDANGRLLVSAAAGGSGLLGSVKIEDATDSNKKVFVDASGRLLVALPPPSPPLGTTEVKVTRFDDVDGNTADYEYYVIPNGETLKIQKLLGSSEDRAKETYVALWLDTNGDTPAGNQKDGHPNWILISMAFTNIGHVNFDLNEDVIGDGVKRIVLHRRRVDTGRRLVYARWQGYY